MSAADVARRLLDEVPPGPWEADRTIVLRDNGWGPPVADAGTEDIAALIAAAPTLIAALLAERDSLRVAINRSVIGLRTQHKPMWRSDTARENGARADGCRGCFPQDGSWPCVSAMIADELDEAIR